MQARSLLFSTILSTALCGGLMLATLSSAQAGNAVQPQGNWSVARVEAKQKGAVPYCALTRRFVNGSVLTFARNANSELSVAVDFPEASFETGKAVTTTLKTGSQNRSFKAAPVSERSVIVRMGKDEKFNQALEKGGQLDVSVADKSLSFNLSDMADGSQDIAACLGQGIEPAAGTTGLDAAQQMQAMPAPSVEEKSVVKPVKMAAASSTSVPAPAISSAVQSSANSDLQSLREENMRLRSALERERREFENSFQKTGENTSGMAEMSEKIRLLQLENDELKLKSGNGEKPATAVQLTKPAEPDMAMGKEIAALKEDNLHLQTELGKQMDRVAMLEKSSDDKAADLNKAAAAQMTDLKNQIAKLESDNKALMLAQNTQKSNNDEVASNDKATLKQLKDAQAQLASLRVERDRLSAEIAQKSNNNDDVAVNNMATLKQLKDAQVQLASLKAERDRLSAEISGIKSADEDGRVRIASDNWDLEQATRRFNEAEREIRRLGSSVEQERAKCEVEKKDIEYMLFDPKIATREQIARLTTLEEKLAQAQADVESAGGNKQKTKELELKIKDMEARMADLSQRNASYEAQASGFETAKVESFSVQQSQNDQSAMVAALQAEVASLNTQMSNTQLEKAAMAAQLSHIQPAAGSASVRSIARADTVVSRAVDVADTEIVPLGVPTGKAQAMRSVVSTSTESVPLQAITSATANISLMNAAEVESLLRQAGIETQGGIRKLDAAMGTGRVAYRWQTQGLFGTAEQRGMEAPAQFDSLVQDYLSSAKSRCQGQFASVPALNEINGNKRISAYEIACVDKGGNGASAALAFYSLDGKTFTTLAHEAVPESMDVAMDARDHLLSVLQQPGKSAAR